jgi:hypothetical protein
MRRLVARDRIMTGVRRLCFKCLQCQQCPPGRTTEYVPGVGVWQQSINDTAQGH